MPTVLGHAHRVYGICAAPYVAIATRTEPHYVPLQAMPHARMPSFVENFIIRFNTPRVHKAYTNLKRSVGLREPGQQPTIRISSSHRRRTLPRAACTNSRSARRPAVALVATERPWRCCHRGRSRTSSTGTTSTPARETGHVKCEQRSGSRLKTSVNSTVGAV